MIGVLRTIVIGAWIFLIAAAIYAVFDVDAAPWMAILAIGAALWPRRRRRCCECDD